MKLYSEMGGVLYANVCASTSLLLLLQYSEPSFVTPHFCEQLAVVLPHSVFAIKINICELMLN